jgi:hypothetical protein
LKGGGGVNLGVGLSIIRFPRLGLPLVLGLTLGLGIGGKAINKVLTNARGRLKAGIL